MIGLSTNASRDHLKFTTDLRQALADADFVQENGPERKDFTDQVRGPPSAGPNVPSLGRETTIYVHSLGWGSRYHPERAALVVEGATLSFRQLHERVRNIAAALAGHGFAAGDRLALLLPRCWAPRGFSRVPRAH